MTTLTTAPGKSIRTLRLLAGLTLEKTAREAGVSVAYLSKVETGQNAASPKWLGHVAGVIASHLTGAD